MLRRQLSVAERAMVAERLANMGHGGDRLSEQSANLHLGSAKSLEDAASDLNVSRRAVAQVRRIKNEAPEVYEKMQRGEIRYQ